MHLKDDELVAGLADQEGGLKLLAATYARVTAPVGFTRMLSPLGNYLVARPAARSAAGKITEATGVPLDAAVVFALSADALHVWSADPMRNHVGEYLGHVPLERITAIEATPGRSWQKLTLVLKGDHHVELEACGASHQLAAAFGQLAGTAS